MWQLILGFITMIIGPLTQYVLKAIGIGIVSYVGFSWAVSEISSYITTHYTGFPATAIQILNLAGVDSAIKNILSALVICASYKAIIRSTGVHWKKPGSPSVFDA